MPSGFEPDVARRPQEIPNRYALGADVRMNDPRAHLYLRSGVSAQLAANAWRWAEKRAVLEIPLANDVEGRKLAVELTIPPFTFERTGPVQAVFSVNGQIVGTARYDTHGQKRFEHSLPPAWLKPNAGNEVAIEVDKTALELDGKTVRGFILTRVGLVK
jgi:hypothetical protein